MTPSSYAHNWYGWITNEMSHVIVGLILAYIIAEILSDPRDGMFSAMFITASWEVIDYLTHANATVLDKLTDALFMASGAALGYLLWKHLNRPLAIAVCMICAAFWIGIWTRL